ncbi:GNAT family N-acetyltransferase [Pseudonocardia acaciae]|uniref:GNAT family N-acetyltransferase n=1 Tax=Pseudonocardia acaciae TaxID=551276 RepID=UPI000A4E7CD3|nr:GNAT family N-acetyltransferase [Pseudonocardia acaciae]
MTRDLDLLLAEMDVQWGFDRSRLLRGPNVLVIAAAADALTAAVSGEVPDELAAQLVERVESSAPTTPGEPPAAVEECRALLPGPLVLAGGPSYLVTPPVPVTPTVPVLRSDDADADSVASARPDNWEPDEWHKLLTRAAGAPWAMVVLDGRVVSICHTPHRSPLGVEAGTWTDPEFRGRGYAAATTAAWADQFTGDRPHLFYSTSADNTSSQRVAERIAARPIGWLWTLAIPSNEPRNDRPAPSVHS